MWKGNKNKNYELRNGRINIIVAIIFLLSASILYKLYDIQVNKYDLYTALASGQHKIFSELEPMRGNIFIIDNKSGSADLYHLATNKEFALVYVIPEDVENKDQDEMAEKLYIIFKKREVEEEVDEYIAEQLAIKLAEELEFVASLNLPASEEEAKKNEVRRRYETQVFDKDWLNFQAIKREAEIKLRKDKIIDEYLRILEKRNDPYEPINKKVDEEQLKDLYALMMTTENKEVRPDDLILKEGQIFIKKEDNLELVEVIGLSHTMVPYRYYPENTVGAHILGFVSTGENKKGNYGLEGFFDEELSGSPGSIKSERGADRNVIIVNDREFSRPVNGHNLILTINRSVQFTVCQKLEIASERHGADSGSVIIIEPSTGEVIAMCSWPTYDPNNYMEVEDISVYNNPVIFDQYEPGSVFKALTMAAAIDQEKITPETTYIDEGQVIVEGWPKPIKNSDYDAKGGHGEVNMNYVLEESLNTGAIFAMQQIGPDIFADYIESFGFGEKTGIELETESQGNIKNLLGDKVQDIYAATASFGQGITVTPLQLIMAYSAIANGGILMKPYIVKEIVRSDGTREITKPQQIKRIISQRAATLVTGMLVNVVESGHATYAGVDGYWVGGKTGTAQVASTVKKGYSNKTIHTFVGFAPIDEPQFVMLVKIDDPKDVIYAASSAAPLFGEIAEYLLQYYQVVKERK